jgi:hypothetical protein
VAGVEGREHLADLRPTHLLRILGRVSPLASGTSGGDTPQVSGCSHIRTGMSRLPFWLGHLLPSWFLAGTLPVAAAVPAAVCRPGAGSGHAVESQPVPSGWEPGAAVAFVLVVMKSA